MALTCWYALSGKNDWIATDVFPVTIAVHRSVISLLKTWVLALGSAWVWGSPAGGGGIAMTLGDGLGLGLGLEVIVSDGLAAAGECRGALACGSAVAHPVTTSTAMASPATLLASILRGPAAIDPVPGIRATWCGDVC